MRVNRPHQIFDGCFQFHRCHSLRDQFRRLRPDDVHPQKLPIFRIGDNLDEAFMLPHDRSTRVCRKRELADFHGVSQLLRLGLGQPHAADLRMAISAVGNFLQIDRLILFSRDLRHRNDPLHRAYMS